MSKDFRDWKIDEVELLPPSVQDYVPAERQRHPMLTRRLRGDRRGDEMPDWAADKAKRLASLRAAKAAIGGPRRLPTQTHSAAPRRTSSARHKGGTNAAGRWLH